MGFVSALFVFVRQSNQPIVSSCANKYACICVIFNLSVTLGLISVLNKSFGIGIAFSIYTAWQQCNYVELRWIRSHHCDAAQMSSAHLS